MENLDVFKDVNTNKSEYFHFTKLCSLYSYFLDPTSVQTNFYINI